MFNREIIYCGLQRILILLLCIILNIVIPDHNAQGVEEFNVQYSSDVSRQILSTFVRWDAVHYIKIACEGYSSEHQLVFFPLYPTIIRLIGFLITCLCNGITLHEAVIIGAVALNIVSFLCTLQVLRHLIPLIYPEISVSSLNTAVFMFAMNPANVFFTVPYTETLFSLFSWTGFYLFTINRKLLSIIPLFLASTLRSNGVLNIIVIFLTGFSSFMCPSNKKAFHVWLNTMKMIMVCFAIVLPTYLYNTVQLSILCSENDVVSMNTCLVNDNSLYCLIKMYTNQLSQQLYAFTLSSNTVLSIDADTIEFCNKHAYSCDTLLNYILQFIYPTTTAVTTSSTVYSYLQAKYWNVGFFSSYQIRQLPNFALAVPISILTIYTIYYYRTLISSPCIQSTTSNSNQDKNMGLNLNIYIKIWENIQNPCFPYVIHLIVVLLLCICIAHIQISTRLICASSPILYCTMAHIYNTTSVYKKWLVWYIILFNIIGILLHCNYYPWTWTHIYYIIITIWQYCNIVILK